MTASSVLVFGILLALPLLALPALLFGAPVDPGLGRAAVVVGGAVFVAVFAAGRRRSWSPAPDPGGRGLQAIRNRILRKRAPLTGLPERLVRERDEVWTVLGAAGGRRCCSPPAGGCSTT